MDRASFDPTPMLAVDDMAAKCAVSKDTATGVGPPWYRLGRRLRCDAAQFARWLEACAVVSAGGGSTEIPDDGGWD